MIRMHFRAAVAAVIAVTVAVALWGCSPLAPGRAQAIASGPVGLLPATALFRVTATARAQNGAIADLVETVFQPVATNPVDTALLDSQCNYPGVRSLKGQPSWESVYPSPLFVTTTITSTVRADSPTWLPDDEVIFYFLGTAAYSGSFAGFEAYCAPGVLGVPGQIHGVAPVPGGDPVGGASGWASEIGSYGFDGGRNDLVAPVVGGTAIVSDCAIQLSAAARVASPVAAAWATLPFVLADGCRFSDPNPA
jgi:hypothetical protein